MKEEVKGFPGWHIKAKAGSHDFVLYTLFKGNRKHVEIVGRVQGELPGAFHTGHVTRVRKKDALATYDPSEARPLVEGVFRQMVQQIANKYPAGLHSRAFQTSSLYAGSLKKMPTYQFDGTLETHRILPEKPEQLTRSSSIEFKTPEAEAHYQQLVDQHGKNAVHDLLRIHPEADKIIVRHQPNLDQSKALQVTSYKFPNKDTGHGHLDSTTTLHPDNTVHNDLINIHNHPPGTGTKILARQVLAARKMGVPSLHIEAGVTDAAGTMNGGYTWPRLGFNGPVRHLAKRDFPGHKDMHSIFATEEGAQKWKEWGGSAFDLSFDTAEDSEHSKRLLAYMKSKGLKL